MAQPFWEGAVEGGIGDWGEVVRKLRPSLVTVSEQLGCLLETPCIRHYFELFFVPGVAYGAICGQRKGRSDKVTGADNQQGSRPFELSSNGLTPQRPHAELLERLFESME